MAQHGSTFVAKLSIEHVISCSPATYAEIALTTAKEMNLSDGLTATLDNDTAFLSSTLMSLRIERARTETGATNLSVIVHRKTATAFNSGLNAGEAMALLARLTSALGRRMNANWVIWMDDNTPLPFDRFLAACTPVHPRRVAIQGPAKSQRPAGTLAEAQARLKAAATGQNADLTRRNLDEIHHIAQDTPAHPGLIQRLVRSAVHVGVIAMASLVSFGHYGS